MLSKSSFWIKKIKSFLAMVFV